MYYKENNNMNNYKQRSRAATIESHFPHQSPPMGRGVNMLTIPLHFPHVLPRWGGGGWGHIIDRCNAVYHLLSSDHQFNVLEVQDRRRVGPSLYPTNLPGHLRDTLPLTFLPKLNQLSLICFYMSICACLLEKNYLRN